MSAACSMSILGGVLAAIEFCVPTRRLTAAIQVLASAEVTFA